MMTLASATVGTRGIITVLWTEDGAMINRLLAMGISPGVSVVLEQRFPSYIVKLGYTRAAIDQDIAQVIWLEPEGEVQKP